MAAQPTHDDRNQGTRGLSIVLIALALLICSAAWMALDRPIVRDRSTAAAEWLDARININLAMEAELQLLPTIGPRLAERIVEDREENGPFASFEELSRVRGIGRVMIERIAPYVTVEP